jgi:predicted lipid-binding transport protein (Tim44 family)
MTDAEARRIRIREKIAASQARLSRNSAAPPALPGKDGSEPPPFPWLGVAGGLAGGLLVGALLPKSTGRMLGKRAIGLAGMAAELALALSRNAIERTGDAGRESAAALGERTINLRSRSKQAASRARSAGISLVGETLKLAARARR